MTRNQNRGLALLISMVIAAVCAISLITPKQAAAVVTILQGDVDGSGTVNVVDVVVLARYLNGAANLRPEMADVNRNGVVDANDLTYLQSYVLVGSVSPPWLGTYTVSDDEYNYDFSGATSYVKHNYATNTNTNYTLVAPLSSLIYTSPSSLSSADPYQPFAATSIVQVGTLVGGTFTRTGTGFIIGSNKVVTSARLLRSGNGNWINNAAIRIINANGTIGPAYPLAEAHSKQSGWDYECALAKVNTSVDLAATYGKVNIGTITMRLDGLNPLIAAAGFGDSGARVISYGGIVDNMSSYEISTTYLAHSADIADQYSVIFMDTDGNPATTNDLVAIALQFLFVSFRPFPVNGVIAEVPLNIGNCFNKASLGFLFVNQNF